VTGRGGAIRDAFREHVGFLEYHNRQRRKNPKCQQIGTWSYGVGCLTYDAELESVRR
jgi:hypothetical protein